MKRRHGYDVTDLLFAPRISYRDAPIGGRPPAAAWTRGVRQIRAFAADVDCRLLAPRLGLWERQHRAEITAIRAAWRLRVDRARQLPGTIASPR